VYRGCPPRADVNALPTDDLLMSRKDPMPTTASATEKNRSLLNVSLLPRMLQGGKQSSNTARGGMHRRNSMPRASADRNAHVR